MVVFNAPILLVMLFVLNDDGLPGSGCSDQVFTLCEQSLTGGIILIIITVQTLLIFLVLSLVTVMPLETTANTQFHEAMADLCEQRQALHEHMLHIGIPG